MYFQAAPVCFSIVDTARSLNELEIDALKLVDNQYVRFDFPDAIMVVQGEQYLMRISGINILPEDTFALYRMGE